MLHPNIRAFERREWSRWNRVAEWDSIARCRGEHLPKAGEIALTLQACARLRMESEVRSRPVARLREQSGHRSGPDIVGDVRNRVVDFRRDAVQPHTAQEQGNAAALDFEADIAPQCRVSAAAK